MPAKLKEKRKRKDESEASNGTPAPSTEDSSDVAGGQSSAAFFNMKSTGTSENIRIEDSAEQSEKILKTANSPSVGSGAKRGRPKGSGKASTWVVPSEREGHVPEHVLPEISASTQMRTSNEAFKPRRAATADATGTSAHQGAHSLLSMVDETAAAAVAVTPAPAPSAPAAAVPATTPAKSTRGRPKGVSGASTWIPPALREQVQQQ